jgi:heptaprenyl diphosphate synthase
MGWKYAAVISGVRVFLVGLLFGSAVSLLYSTAGAVVSFLCMVLLKKTGRFSYTAVSVAGGVMHNMGQIAMACILMSTNILKYYAPFLILSGTLAGIVIGLLSAVLVKRINVKV